MPTREPQVSDELMGLAMEFRFHVIDEVRKLRPTIIIPQLRAGTGHLRSFSIVPGGEKTVTVHRPTTRKRSYEFFTVSIMNLYEAMSEDEKTEVAKGLGGIAPLDHHSEKQDRFTGDTDADPFRKQLSLGAIYEAATAIRRGGNLSPDVSMEFEAVWNGDKLKTILIHIQHPLEIKPTAQPEKLGKKLENIPRKEATRIAEQSVEMIRNIAEERFRISPANLEPYISLDKTGTQVFGIGLRRWID